MSYQRMDHAGWVESNWPPPAGKLTDFQAKVMDILGMVGGGICFAPIAWRTVQWVHGRNGLSLIWKDRNGLSTFDFDELTKLVFLCHEARIRCCIDPGGPRMFRLSFWPRVHDGAIYARHPNLDEAVAAFRAYLPTDHRIIYKEQSKHD